MTVDGNYFCPFAGNEFATRGDVEKGFLQIFEPLVPLFSPGGARVRVDGSSAFCDLDSSDLEGFSRPLWGLVPYAAGGGKFEHWHLYHKGLSNGTNPSHPEFWGEAQDLEQRLVEFAVIGFALSVIPEQFFDPIPDDEKPHIIEYLVRASERKYPVTNWKWFHVFLTFGLKRIGANYDHSITTRNLSDMDTYYLDDGWYGDGPEKNAIDYYNPWAFHVYSVLYLKLCSYDTERCKVYRERAKKFISQFKHWFANDGAALPYGRSLTYKFACGSFWGALAFAEEELLPWGLVKGLYLRHLRWWSKQPFGRESTGIMSLGFAYPNQIMCERYNSAQSPYWGTKIFFPLALSADHPFWKAKEVPLELYETTALPIPGMVFSHFDRNTVALVSGPYQNGSYVRFGGEKYCKFAYSTRYGFSVESNDRSFDDASLDNMIGFSEDGQGFRFRVKMRSRICDKVLYSTWTPWSNVHVETWLIPKGAWHIRVHRITSDRNLVSAEGGFAISALQPANRIVRYQSAQKSYVINEEDFSGIVDLGGNRSAVINTPEPNSNLLVPKTVVPHLRGEVHSGVTVLACAVLAMPDIRIVNSSWTSVPEMPSIESLDDYVTKSVPVLQE